MKQSRFTSWTAWLTLLPVIILLGDTYGLWNVINMPQKTFSKLFMAVGTALIAFGIFNNPLDRQNF
jgi:uncharacterized membrane protein